MLSLYLPNVYVRGECVTLRLFPTLPVSLSHSRFNCQAGTRRLDAMYRADYFTGERGEYSRIRLMEMSSLRPLRASVNLSCLWLLRFECSLEEPREVCFIWATSVHHAGSLDRCAVFFLLFIRVHPYWIMHPTANITTTSVIAIRVTPVCVSPR